MGNHTSFQAVDYTGVINEFDLKNDSIYTEDYSSNFNIENSSLNDTDYGREDYSLSVFNTTLHDFRFCLQNGVPLPIRQKNKLRTIQYEMTGDKKYMTSGGVTVVENFYIRNLPNDKVDSILNYIEKMKIELANRSIVSDKNLKIFLNTVESDIKNKNYLGNNHYSIRLLTHVDSDYLISHKRLFLTKCNLVLFAGQPDVITPHPLTNEFKRNTAYEELTKHDVSELISIEIINNENPGKNYYINMLNDVVKIQSKVSNVLPSQVTILHKRDDNMICNSLSNLEDIEQFNVFDTQEGAIANGSPEHMIKLRELENNKSTLDIKKEQLKYDNIKLKFDYHSLGIASRLETVKLDANLNKLQAEERILAIKEKSAVMSSGANLISLLTKVIK